MAIDYEAIRLMHDCHGAILSTEDTHRRLAEIRNNINARFSPITLRLQKTLSRKSDYLNATEAKVLSEFPTGGINISFDDRGGLCSNALIYARAFRYMPNAKHVAIVSLIRLDFLGIVRGYHEGSRNRPMEVIVKL